jgi:hypothetical protein
MANAFAVTVLDFRMRRLIVCSIVTDTASNECAALNPGLATSVQRVTGINVFRTTCFSAACEGSRDKRGHPVRRVEGSRRALRWADERDVDLSVP